MCSHRSAFLLMVLMIFLTACVSSTPAVHEYIDGPVPPDQAKATAIVVEKVVTLLPESEMTASPRNTEPPQVLAFNENPQKTAADNLRAFLGVPDLELTFQRMENSPNASLHPPMLFTDSLGNNYYISLISLQPVEFTILQMIQEPQAANKTPDELRAIAEAFAKAHSTKFEKVKDRLAYNEGNKGGENNFFHWEMTGTDVGGGTPATLQIGLKQDGRLFCYLNSLDFLP